MRLRGSVVLAVLVAACHRPAASPARGATAASASALPPLPPAPRDPYSSPVAATFVDAEDAALTPPDRAEHLRAREAARSGQLGQAKRILGRLAVGYPDHAVLVAQYNAVNAMIDDKRAAAKASLEAATLHPLDPPPVKYTLVRHAPVSDSAIPKLTKVSQKRNQITDEAAWFSTHDVHLPLYFVPPSTDMLFAPGAISTVTVADLLAGFVYTEYTPAPAFHPAPLPLEIPLAYGTARLREAIDSKPYVLGIYGDRILAVFDAPDHVVGVFDFASYAHPRADREGKRVVGKATVKTAEGSWSGDLAVETHTISHSLTFALASDGVLYVEHANLSYAKDNHGQTGYVSAIDIASGALLWRSAPLVANARSFALVRGALVCGYGFTAEPDFVYVLDRATGAKKQTLPVRTSPETIVPKGSTILVRGYDTDFAFDVR